jgi:hypothetical protein
MQLAKLTPKLVARLEGSVPSEMFDLVLELDPHSNRVEGASSLSRTEKIARQKEAFNSILVLIENAIREAGGEVTGGAWINHTVRARVPAGAVGKLAELEMITSVDTPNPLRKDTP